MKRYVRAGIRFDEQSGRVTRMDETATLDVRQGKVLIFLMSTTAPKHARQIGEELGLSEGEVIRFVRAIRRKIDPTGEVIRTTRLGYVLFEPQTEKSMAERLGFASEREYEDFLRRKESGTASKPDILVVGHVKLNTINRQAWHVGHLVKLTDVRACLLGILMRRSGEVVPWTDLALAWEDPETVTSKRVKSTIMGLRDRIGPGSIVSSVTPDGVSGFRMG